MATALCYSAAADGELNAQITALPRAVTNNAVAAGRIGDAQWVFSVMGVDSSRRWSGITRRAAAWSSTTRAWQSLPDIPGATGRLAATAQVVGEKLFVFGGYTVDSSGAERSLGNVDIFHPATNAWSRGTPIPVPVDDAVSGVYRDSLVYLVSGWRDTNNVRDVQLYDVRRDRWTSGTAIPGPGVFGHSGSIAGGTIVYVDGAVKRATSPRYALVAQTWTGEIDPRRPERITWRPGPLLPAGPIYRAAAGSCGRFVIIAGGTRNPYNYDGIGYDGRPAEPLSQVTAFDTETGMWRSLAPLTTGTMDHRGLPRVDGVAWVIGGMRSGQRVSASVEGYPLPDCDLE